MSGVGEEATTIVSESGRSTTAADQAAQVSAMVDMLSGSEAQAPLPLPTTETPAVPDTPVSTETQPTPASTEPVAEKDEKDTAIETLQRTVAELSAKISELSAPRTEQAAPAQPTPTPVPTPAPIAASDFFESEEEYNKAFEDRATFNKVLIRVQENAARNGAQAALTMLPKIVTNLIRSETTLRSQSEDFYKSNVDLATMKPFVSFVANDLAAKNPSWDTNKLFTELGKEVRTRAGLKAAAAAATASAAGKVPGPAFAKGGGSRKPPSVKPDLSPQEKQILDLIPS